MEKIVASTLDDITEQFQNINWRVISFDTETTSLNYTKLDIEGFSLCDGDTALYIDLIDNPDKDKILDLLGYYLSKTKLLIGHNLVFDLKVLYKLRVVHAFSPPYVSFTPFDTMVADHLLNENRISHSLKYLADKILGYDVTKYEDIADHQSKEFYEYATNDAIWTWELMLWQRPQLKAEGLVPLFTQIEMPFQWVLLEMEIAGFRIDKNKLQVTKKRLEEELNKLKKEMLKVIKYPFTIELTLTGEEEIISDLNLNSSQQLAELLYTTLQLPIEEYTPKGQPSVGKTALNKLKGKHPFVDLLRKYKIAQKLLTAFFSPLPKIIDDDGKVRPNFRDIGTVTGRLSCNKPNLQQLPKVNEEFPVDTRECFIASEGKKLIACDYSGQELRVLAKITGEESMIDAFKKGKDFHLTTANDFFDLNIPEEALYETHPEYEKYKEKYKNERSKAKTINFGMAYGKAQPLHSKIATENGWKTFKTIRVGDRVFTQEGKLSRVKQVKPVTPQKTYRLSFSDGTSTECSENHLWTLQTTYDKINNKYRTLETKDIIPILRKGNQNNCYVDYCNPLEYKKRKLFLHPYLMGLYLGDGDNCNRYSIFNSSGVNKVSQYIPDGYRLSKSRDGHYSIVTTKKKNSKQQYISNNKIIILMRQLGLSGKTCYNKFIPRTYMQASVNQRLQLLEGLIDSDGSKNNNGYEYVSVSKQLAYDVRELVLSLGGRVNITSRVPKTNFNNAKLSYRVFISFPPFRRSKSINNIEYLGIKQCRCITIEDEKGLYLTDDFIVTHNSSYGFSKDFGISEDEAQGILDKYFATLPKVKEKIDETHSQVKAEGFVTSMTGRKRRFSKQQTPYGLYYTNSSLRQAFNFLIQGYSADMMRLAMNKVYELAKFHPEWELKAVATVHDEAVYEVKEQYAEKASTSIKDAFESTVNWDFPIVAESKVGNNYSEVK